jgi:hypothetical protein
MNRLAAVDLWSEWITDALTVFIVKIVVFGVLTVPPIVVQKWMGTHHSVGIWGLLYLCYIYALLLSTIIAGGPWLLMPKVGDHPYFRFLHYPLGTWTAAVILVYVLLIYRVASSPHIVSHHWAIYLCVAAMLGTVAYGGAIVATIILTAPLFYALSQRTKVLYADALLVDRLVSLLAYIEQNPRQWNQGAFKKQVITKLEALAIGVEAYLFRGLHPKDNVTEAWLKGRSREIAAAFRALKSWILTPMSDTAIQLKQRLSMLLVHAAAGDWDSLERLQAVAVSESRLWRTRILNWVGVILTGGIPLLLFELVQRMPTLKLPDPVAQYVHVGVLMWAALALIAAFDPLFGAKISALKDVFQLLPIPGKKKD